MYYVDTIILLLHYYIALYCTILQGSAADIVMMAMIKLWRSETLKTLGWRLLLQIHDEVILEGPKESVDQVRGCKIDIGAIVVYNLLF